MCVACPLRGCLLSLSLRCVSAAAPGKRDMHTAAVTGVAVDGLNRFAVSASLDATLKFWDFPTRALLETVPLGSPASRLVSAPAAAVCCGCLRPQLAIVPLGFVRGPCLCPSIPTRHCALF